MTTGTASSCSNRPAASLAGDLPAVEAVNLGKCYHPGETSLQRLRRLVLGKRNVGPSEFWALRNLNLTVQPGQVVGLLGANGSGKSTFLQLVAGTVTPSEGRVDVRGRVCALLELGSGFNPEFTGRDNVYVNAGILGLSRREIDEKFDAIVAFADIGKFLDAPVRTYSSGMLVRLAFSVAVSVEPDVLLVDEALAVGDFRFQQRCLARIRDLRDKGVTILFVTHDLEAAKRLCDDLYVLDQGQLVRSGPAPLVANWYLSHLTRGESRQVFSTEVDERGGHDTNPFQTFRHGSGGARIVRVELQGLDGTPTTSPILDETYRLRIVLAFSAAFAKPVLGFYVRDRLGTDLIGINTHHAGTPLPAVVAGDELTVDFLLPFRLRPGRYGVSCAVAPRAEEFSFLDWIDNALVFDLVDWDARRHVFGLTYTDVRVEISPRTAQPAAA